MIDRIRKKKENKTELWAVGVFQLIFLNVTVKQGHLSTKTHINLAKCLFLPWIAPILSSTSPSEYLNYFFSPSNGKATIKGNGFNVKLLVIPLSFQILGKITGLASMCPTLFLLSIGKQLVCLLGKGSILPHRWFTKLPRTESPIMKYSVSVFSLSKCDGYSFSCLFFQL